MQQIGCFRDWTTDAANLMFTLGGVLVNTTDLLHAYLHS